MSSVLAPESEVALFGHWICPFSTRVEFALVERTIPFALVDVPPTAARPPGYVVPDEFVRHSPRGEIPMVRVGDRYRADSLPILAWLEEVRNEPSLVPEGAGPAGLAWERAGWLDANLYPAMIGIYYGTDDRLVAGASDALGDTLVEIDRWLGDGEWLAGERISVAEAVMVPFYVRRRGLERLGLRAELPDRVARHEAATMDRPAGRAVAWSREQTEEFVGRFERYRVSRRSR